MSEQPGERPHGAVRPDGAELPHEAGRPDRASWAALRHHGDAELVPGALDFAVNVRGSGPPGWLRDRLAARLADLGGYPGGDDDEAALSAVAAQSPVPVAVDVRVPRLAPETEARLAGLLPRSL